MYVAAVVLPIDIEGPVHAEVFVVAHDGESILLTGPCGAAPWDIETQGVDHPLDLVRSMSDRVLGDVKLLHSTSWRWDKSAVILSFVVVIDAEEIGAMPAEPVGRVALARSAATEAPEDIGWLQVLEHGLRHLAWLAAEDDIVQSTLDDPWKESLSAYVPAPFQQLEVT